MTPQVLVVEDEAISAMAVTYMLESAGCAVVGVAVSGREAIELALETRPDVVLMDIRLKGEMSGVDSAQVIQDRLQTPIVFTTAYSVEEIRETCGIDPGCLFVTKPIREDELAQAITTACNQI
jgi:hypothetical protein